MRQLALYRPLQALVTGLQSAVSQLEEGAAGRRQTNMTKVSHVLMFKL